MGSVLYLQKEPRAREQRGTRKPSPPRLQLQRGSARRARRGADRRRGVFQGVPRRRAARAALDLRAGVGLQQPHAAALRPRCAKDGAAGAARRLPQLPGAAPPRPAHQRAELGLPDGVRHRPRVPAALRLRLDAAPARAPALRRHASDRRLPAPEDRRDRRRDRVRRRHRPHRAALGHARTTAPTTRGASPTRSPTRRSTT